MHPKTKIDFTGEAVLSKCLTLRGLHNYAPDHLVAGLDFLAQNHTRVPFEKLTSGRYRWNSSTKALHSPPADSGNVLQFNLDHFSLNLIPSYLAAIDTAGDRWIDVFNPWTTNREIVPTHRHCARECFKYKLVLNYPVSLAQRENFSGFPWQQHAIVTQNVFYINSQQGWSHYKLKIREKP